jgi:hypothetical protein
MNKDQLFVEEHRGLSAREINLIQWLLVETNNLEFVEQIKKTNVITKCGCGCKTIDLQVEGYEPKSGGLTLSAQGFSTESVPVDVILHIRNGLISELEVYAIDDAKEFSLPETDSLVIY